MSHLLIALFSGAYCYAELGCMIKKSGADYAYIHVSFGPLAAFIRLWIECIIVRPCTGAIQSLSFSLYILKPFFPECDPPVEVTRLLAASCLCLLCFINCYSVRLSNMVGFIVLRGRSYMMSSLRGVHQMDFKKSSILSNSRQEKKYQIIVNSQKLF